MSCPNPRYNNRIAVIFTLFVLASTLIFSAGCQAVSEADNLREAESQLEGLEADGGVLARLQKDTEAALAKLADLEGQIDKDLLDSAVNAKQAQLDQIMASSAEVDAQIVSAKAMVVERQGLLERAEERDGAFFGLGETAAGVIAGFSPPASAAVLAFLAIFKRERRLRVEAKVRTAEETAMMFKRHVNTLRAQIPALDEAFREVEGKHKAVADLAFKGSEHLLTILRT